MEQRQSSMLNTHTGFFKPIQKKVQKKSTLLINEKPLVSESSSDKLVNAKVLVQNSPLLKTGHLD